MGVQSGDSLFGMGSRVTRNIALAVLDFSGGRYYFYLPADALPDTSYYAPCGLDPR